MDKIEGLTEKQTLLHTVAKGVLAFTAATVVRMGVEKAYDKVVIPHFQESATAL